MFKLQAESFRIGLKADIVEYSKEAAKTISTKTTDLILQQSKF